MELCPKKIVTQHLVDYENYKIVTIWEHTKMLRFYTDLIYNKATAKNAEKRCSVIKRSTAKEGGKPCEYLYLKRRVTFCEPPDRLRRLRLLSCAL